MILALAILISAPLHVSTQLEHTYLSESAGGEVYLQIDLAAEPSHDESAQRVPVNAVMILDRSGSMSGRKIERAREAARALIEALGPRDRFAIVDFSDSAHVLVPSTEATVAATVSTFGIGEDYDEQFMTRLAVQAGGRARYVSDGAALAQAFAAEFFRSAATVAHDVRLDVRTFKNIRVERVIGFENASGEIRLPDIAAGEERRVMVKLLVPPGRGTAELADIELHFRDASGQEQKIHSSAQASYTADVRELDAEKPNRVTWQAAMGEMADAAATALRFQAENKPAQAEAEEARLQTLAVRAAASAPAAAAQALRKKAMAYGEQLSASGAGAQPVRKELSVEAADDSTAPAAF